jgi:hypothetical protein
MKTTGTRSTAEINPAQVHAPQVQEAQLRLTPLDENHRYKKHSGDQLRSSTRTTGTRNTAEINSAREETKHK